MIERMNKIYKFDSNIKAEIFFVILWIADILSYESVVLNSD